MSLPCAADQHPADHVGDEKAIRHAFALDEARRMLFVKAAHENAACAEDKMGQKPAQERD